MKVKDLQALLNKLDPELELFEPVYSGYARMAGPATVRGVPVIENFYDQGGDFFLRFPDKKDRQDKAVQGVSIV